MWRVREPASKWEFATSESKGLGVSFALAIQAGKGAFYAKDPLGAITQFNYVNLGVGAGTPGAKVPGLKHGGATVSGTGTLSTGKIYMLNTFAGKELQAKDMTGICMFAEASAGFGVGGSATAMVLGMSLDGMEREFKDEIIEIALFGIGLGSGQGAHELARPTIQDFRPDTMNSAKAALAMAGMNVGLQAGATIVGGFGLVWLGDLESLVDDSPIAFEPEIVNLRRSNGTKELKLIVPNDALFDFDKDRIGTRRRPNAAPLMLARVAKIIRDEPAYRILLVGYTDSIGWAAYNQGLSERRANNVRNWLVRNGGVKPERFLDVRGEGESSPVAPNYNPAGRAKNRRVEITLVPR